MVEISREYLGPVSERFVSRQIKMHLNKDVEDITKADIKKLVKWIRPAIAHITHDKQYVDDYTDKLKALAGNSPAKNRERHAEFPAR